MNARQKFFASIKKKRMEKSQLHDAEITSDEESDEEKLDAAENLEKLCPYCGISLRKGNLNNHNRTVHNCEVEEKFIYDVSF